MELFLIIISFSFHWNRLVELLSEQRASTKENVERKQARTDGEREEEEEDVVEVNERKIFEKKTRKILIFPFFCFSFVM